MCSNDANFLTKAHLVIPNAAHAHPFKCFRVYFFCTEFQFSTSSLRCFFFPQLRHLCFYSCDFTVQYKTLLLDWWEM